MKKLACVTGASGLIGSRIMQRLLALNYEVRVLTRGNFKSSHKNTEVFTGGLDNMEFLQKFVRNADLVFHCAGELHDIKKMQQTNIEGTQNLVNAVKKTDIKYFCFISSAGVTGLTKEPWVTEETPCAPQNMYERSKLAAEKIVLTQLAACNTVCLRPTNVIDWYRPGALKLYMQGGLAERIKTFVKGGECAHIIHADDVAAAAVFFSERVQSVPQCYILSYDDQPLNTYAGLWALCQKIDNGQPPDDNTPIQHLPLWVPHLLRMVVHGKSNRGNVRYSNEKLFMTGFVYPLGFLGAIQSITGAKRWESQ